VLNSAHLGRTTRGRGTLKKWCDGEKGRKNEKQPPKTNHPPFRRRAAPRPPPPLIPAARMQSADLYASAPVFRTECAEANVAFIKCKMDNGGRNAHPEKCLKEGDVVTACVDGVHRRLQASCNPAMDAYKACLETNAPTASMQFATCKDLAEEIKDCDARARSKPA